MIQIFPGWHCVPVATVIALGTGRDGTGKREDKMGREGGERWKKIEQILRAEPGGAAVGLAPAPHKHTRVQYVDTRTHKQACRAKPHVLHVFDSWIQPARQHERTNNGAHWLTALLLPLHWLMCCKAIL